jgi:hypothetical protein
MVKFPRRKRASDLDGGRLRAGQKARTHEAERRTTRINSDKLLAIIRRCGFINPDHRRGERQCYCGSLDLERLRNRRSKEKRHG